MIFCYKVHVSKSFKLCKLVTKLFGPYFNPFPTLSNVCIDRLIVFSKQSSTFTTNAILYQSAYFDIWFDFPHKLLRFIVPLNTQTSILTFEILKSELKSTRVERLEYFIGFSCLYLKCSNRYKIFHNMLRI